MNPKRRARRIAADEAHAWARNLRLNNPHAKLTLSMLSLYVDGEGYCFVSIPTLAEDTELSLNTVRSRLTWLEQLGVIARQNQWIDEYGRRNGDGRGKRTSDLIRLLMDVDQDALDAIAGGGEGDVSREVSPPPGGGLNPDDETVRTPLALRQPSDSVEGLISEPEPESPPSAPSGGESERDAGSDDPEGFAAAWSTWPGHELMRRDLALAEWAKLTAEQRQQCRAVIPLFVKLQGQHKRDTTPNFHIWLRTRGFDEFPRAATEGMTAVLTTSFDVSSVEGRAIKALFGVAGALLFEHGGRVTYPLPVTPRVIAFGNLPERSAWHWIEDRQQIAAWSQFLSAHIHRPRPELVTTRGQGDDARRGMFAPWPWPPRKDGSISESSEDAA